MNGGQSSSTEVRGPSGTGDRRPTRAAAMPADERRAAIIAATLPLLMQHGTALTTRQIAESAGIAEGTIFRVFPDKDTLIQAVVEAALDPAVAEAALAEIDRAQPLEQRLTAAVEIIQRRLVDIWRLFSAVGFDSVKNRGRHKNPELVGLSELFEPEHNLLNREPRASAQILYALTLALSHPMLTIDPPSPPADVVAILLDGIRRPAPDTVRPPTPTRRQTDTESRC